MKKRHQGIVFNIAEAFAVAVIKLTARKDDRDETADVKPKPHQRKPFATMTSVRNPCKFFERGQCDGGEDCEFDHITTKQTPHCRDHKHGHCRRGAACPFLHVEPTWNEQRSPRTEPRRDDRRDTRRDDTRDHKHKRHDRHEYDRERHSDEREPKRTSRENDQRDSPKRRENDRDKHSYCMRCEKKGHHYGPSCPEYGGCKRCGDMKHLVKQCDKACTSCDASAKTQCNSRCKNAAFRLGHEKDRRT